MLRIRILTVLILTCSFTSIAHAELKVGVGKAIITPNPLLPVSGGVGPGKPSTGKQGELTARAMVFQQGETKVAIVQLDLLGFPSVLCARVHKQVPRIPADNILIGSTHTHSAPDCYGFPGLDGKTSGDLKYMDFVCNQAAIAINQALDNLQTAQLKIATGEAKGKIAYNYYAPELYDPRMSVIQAITPAGKTIGTLVNYAIHPEVLGNGLGLVSPDLVGPLCDKLEADLGGMGMFMNGAQGGMITADNRRLDNPSDPLHAKWHDSRTWEECLRIGQLMASEAQRIVKDAEPQTDPVDRLLCSGGQVPRRFEPDVDDHHGLPVEIPAQRRQVDHDPHEPGQHRQRPDPHHSRRSPAQHRLLPQTTHEGRQQPARSASPTTPSATSSPKSTSTASNATNTSRKRHSAK